MRELAALLVLAGVFGALIGVPLVVDPSGYNPHSPAKAAALMISVSLIIGGFTLRPALLRDALARLRQARSVWALALMALLALGSWAFSLDPSQSFVGSYPDYQGLIALAAYAVVALGATSIVALRQARQAVLRGIVIVCLGLGLLVALSRAGADPLSLGESASQRPFATLGSASTLGAYLVLCLPLTVERLFADRAPAWRATSALSLLVGGMALVWTSSRGAWVGVAAATVTWIVFWSRGRTRIARRRVLAGMAAVAISAAATAFFLAPNVVDRVISVFDPSSSTVAWRLSVWETTFDLSLERPVLGWGPNSFRYSFPPVRPPETNLESIAGYFVSGPHNLFLDVAVSLGWPAVLAFIVGVGLVLRESWRAAFADKRNHLLVTSASSALVGGLVALQFHTLTFSTGALLAALFAWCATLGVNGRVSGLGKKTARALEPPPWRRAMPVLLAASLVASGLAIGLVVSDRAARRAFDLASWGARWENVSDSMELARAAAPWEPIFDQMYVRAALYCAAAANDPAGIAAGISVAKRASLRLPLEAGIVSDGAGLLLASAEQENAEHLARAALAEYERALRMDPSDADHWLGIGRCQGFLGDQELSIAAFEEAVWCAPYSDVAWEYLAVAYATAGRDSESLEARDHDESVLRRAE